MANAFGDGYIVKKWLVIPSVVRELGDGYIVKKMACHPERSEGTQR